MKISQIDTSVYYPVTIPSTGLVTKFKPFRVREEKALLTAQVSGDTHTMLNTLESIVRACVADCPSELTTFDVEFLFLQLRAKSVEESATAISTCASCGVGNSVVINLETAQLTDGPESMTLELAPELKVKMKYPSIADVLSMADASVEDKAEQSIMASIESIFFGDTVYHTAEGDVSEIEEFLLNRSATEMDKLIDFIERIPTVKLKTEYTCKGCATVNQIELETLSDFF